MWHTDIDDRIARTAREQPKNKNNFFANTEQSKSDPIAMLVVPYSPHQANPQNLYYVNAYACTMRGRTKINDKMCFPPYVSCLCCWALVLHTYHSLP